MFKKKHHHLFPIGESDRVSIDRFDDDGFFENISKGSDRLENHSSDQFVGTPVVHARLRIAVVFIVTILFILVSQATYLQLVQGQSYATQADDNRFQTIVTPSHRGVITDRNGMVLASNTPVFNILIQPSKLPKTERERLQLYSRLESMGIQSDRYQDYLVPETTDLVSAPQLVARNVNHQSAIQILANIEQFPGIAVEESSKRSYITYAIPTLSHILGYTGVLNPEEYKQLRELGYRPFDHVGKQGIEKTYEETLRGTFGSTTVEVNATGAVKRILSETAPLDGENVTLSIDAGLQSTVESILEARMNGTPSTKASVVIMDPRNGEILSLVSWPGYDANLFPNGDSDAYASLLEDSRHPLFPRATSGEAPSGSTIKTVFASGALMEGIITPSTVIQSTGGIQVGPWFFPDWRGGGHGPTNVFHAIADSVNTFFYYIGAGYQEFEGMGIVTLMRYAELFGFGKPTGIDLPGEADGFLPSMEWKMSVKGERWYVGDTYNTSIGQGDLLVTPLQMARATAVFANKGYLITPRLTVISPEEAPTMERIIPEETAKTIAQAMRQTITAGSATSLQLVPVAVAGKTGTAQWSSTKPNHSWFTGFAPYENPEIVITVLMEEGGDSSLAIPVTREILSYWFASSSN